MIVLQVKAPETFSPLICHFLRLLLLGLGSLGDAEVHTLAKASQGQKDETYCEEASPPQLPKLTIDMCDRGYRLEPAGMDDEGDDVLQGHDELMMTKQNTKRQEDRDFDQEGINEVLEKTEPEEDVEMY